MANRTYLVVTDNETIYPSYAEPDFDPASCTIAQAPYCVPLLWMGLFREQDMRRQEVDGELGALRMLAPLVEATTGLRQLREAIPVLEQLFASGTLNEFYDMLSAAILTTDRKYVTLELEEVAYMFNPRAFFGRFATALRAITGGDAFERDRDHVRQIAQLQVEGEPPAVPPARCVIDGDYTSLELQLHSSIIGCQWVRAVHWESDLTIPTEARVNPSMDMIYAALFEILCCVMSVDGKIAAAERQQLATILAKVGVGWSGEETAQRTSAFVDRVAQKSFPRVLEEALGHVPMFKRIGRESVLTRCTDIITEADGIVDQHERDLCDRINAILKFAD